ncbi:MAG: hypothetical protein DI598_04710 [Pseudopedobacter saltans]|uniref:SAM-dependent MTase RsmB/NOP-type domain-containing protein n=1 Tax=Pseudopedobacter saltans TaxID=151895 RepID=A0A2W5H5J6_9SPHI|nr:MAG: hypothetical protein DI598_04710 [Pseudopedobacter saltans]
MSKRFFSYHNTACKLIASYQKQMPLQHFLKQYFSENKKHGSKDRKWISHFCYCFYRLGKSLSNMSIESRLPIAIYLCTDDLAVLGEYLSEKWPRTDSLDERIQYVEKEYDFKITDVFPFPDLVVEEIDFVALNKSFLRQPDVFLRIRPGKTEKVIRAFESSNMSFEQNGNAVKVKNRTAIEQVVVINKDVVIQDLSSQKIATLFPDKGINSIWDCCAASGGKTLLARDYFPKAKITVSDIRPSILQNHKKRMQEAGVSVQKYWTIDLSQPIQDINDLFDLIICDAPCSGSGTWARTPEEMYFFEKENLKNVSNLQQTIVRHIFGQLKDGGIILYITCSIFKEEDDDVVREMAVQCNLTIEKHLIINGLTSGSDSLFGCVLKKS